MRVILKKDVDNLGSKGDIVEVAPGFGRNYLIPKRLALEVTSSNMKMIEIERQALKKKLEKERQSFEGLIQNLNQVALSFKRKTGERDMIFGSVSASDIKDALHELGFEIDKKRILLDEPIKRLGNYSVPIKIFQEDKAEIKVEVIKPEGEIGEEKKEEAAPEEKMEELAGEREELEEAQKKGEEPEEKKDEQEKTSEEQLKEDEAVSKEPEGEREEKKKEEEIPEEKKEEIEEESKKPEIEVQEKEGKEVLEDKNEEGGMLSEKEKAEAEAERREKEGEKDKKEEEGERKRSKK